MSSKKTDSDVGQERDDFDSIDILIILFNWCGATGKKRDKYLVRISQIVVVVVVGILYFPLSLSLSCILLFFYRS